MISKRAIPALCVALAFSSASAQNVTQDPGLLRGVTTANVVTRMSARTPEACAIDTERLAARAQVLTGPTRLRLIARGETAPAATPSLLIVGDTRLVAGACEASYAVVVIAPVEPTRIAATGVPWTGTVDLWRSGAARSSAPGSLQVDMEGAVEAMVRQLLAAWEQANR